MRRLHIANADNRNAIVVATPPKAAEKVIQGLEGDVARFRRYIAVGSGYLHEDLIAQHGDDLSTSLITADPEIDFDRVGQFLEGTQSMLMTSTGEPMYASPQFLDVVLDARGNEVSRKAPVDVAATVTEEIPLRWTGKKVPRGEGVRQFMFRRSLQIRHVDGVTYDFLFSMAKQLHDEDVMILMGAGEKGKDPVVLQLNGSPYRGFLEGRVNGDSFILLLHLSNMELKRPAKEVGA